MEMGVVASPERSNEQRVATLLEVLGHEQITIFGETGTLQDLAEKCPIPLTDPRMTPEAIDRFVVNVYHKAGKEVSAELAPRFNRIADDLGIKPNYTIVKPQQERVKESDTVPERSPIIEEKAINPVVLELVTLTDRRIDEVVWRRQVEMATIITDVGEDTEDSIAPTVNTSSIVGSEIAPVEKIVSAPRLVVAEPERLTETVMPSRVAEPAPTEVDQIATLSPPEAVVHDDVMTPPLETADFVEQPEVAESIVSSEMAWRAELQQEPEVVLADFSTALQNMVELSNLFAFVEGESSELPPIIPAVSERLASLTPREQAEVAPIIKDIVGALHGLELLAAQDGNEALVLAVQEQLQELCVTLFEALGIDYTEQDIAVFLEVLASPQLQKLLLAEKNVEELGTHEVKHFKDVMRDWGRSSAPLHNLLGMVALLSSREALMVG
ncbi:MAG: hypothetical protein JWN82_84 [Candidatus Saccharibacteria bacterium]|nr:hypothetical protein [Candidatus Saccharibacteria bacterium]